MPVASATRPWVHSSLRPPLCAETQNLAKFAFDEVLRWESPFQTSFRATSRDVEISGTVDPRTFQSPAVPEFGEPRPSTLRKHRGTVRHQPSGRRTRAFRMGLRSDRSHPRGRSRIVFVSGKSPRLRRVARSCANSYGKLTRRVAWCETLVHIMHRQFAYAGAIVRETL